MSINLDVLIGLNVLSVIILSIIFIACFMEPKNSPTRSNYFIAMISFEILYLIFNTFQYNTERAIISSGTMTLENRYIAYRGLSNIAFFLVLIAFALYTISFFPDKTKVPKWIPVSIIALCALSALGCALTIFFPSLAEDFFYVDQGGSHVKASFLIAQAGSYYLAAALLYLLIKNRRELNRNNIIALVSFIACPTIVSIMRFFGVDIYYMAPATVVSFVLMYCFLYVQKSEKIHSQDLLLANNRLAVLQNQIRPHFLFNTLNSIYVLCDKDPKTAQKAIGDFSEYMRANLENLEEDSVIPLDKELDLVDHYLNLEKMRFGGDLEVVYDTDYVDMMIPPMTVQILAENAVKHGIEKKTDGFGRVTIRTRRTTSSDLVIVEDNGVGFDVEEYNSDPGSHIGIVNAKERLKHLLGATLIIESSPGKGTTVTVIIPREKKANEKAEKEEEVEEL